MHMDLCSYPCKLQALRVKERRPLRVAHLLKVRGQRSPRREHAVPVPSPRRRLRRLCTVETTRVCL